MTISSKKVRAKDIAQEAGVSEATVSYILNDRKDVKISEATRKKVLQLCNLMQYAPSQTAKSLATGKYNSIGIQFNILPNSPSRNLRIMQLLLELQSQLQSLNYDTLIMPSLMGDTAMRIQRNIDGIICIDLPESQFFTIKENYFVPIISIDMNIGDPIFFTVCDDISAIITKAKALLSAKNLSVIVERHENDALMQCLADITANDSLYIYDNRSSLRTYLTNNLDKSFVIFGEYLATACLDVLPNDNVAVVVTNMQSPQDLNNVKKIVLSPEQKTTTVINSLISAIERNNEATHWILLPPS